MGDTMGWYLAESATLSLTTPEAVIHEAQALQAAGNSDSERPLLATRKARIQAAILDQAMRPFHWALAEVPSEGCTVRVNGQHSSTVFLELNSEEWTQVRFPVVIHKERYICAARTDVATLFRTFDTPWSGRSLTDVMGAFISVNDQLHGQVERGLTLTLTRGLVWYEQQVIRVKGTADRLFQVLSDPQYHPFLRWAQATLDPKRTTDMLTKPVVAAMFHSLRTGEELARQFWGTVATGKAASDSDTPAHKLSVFLEMVLEFRRCAWPAPYSAVLPRGQQRPNDKDVFATCLRAVSAHLHDRKVGEIFYSAKKRKLPELAQELYPLRQSIGD